MQTFINQRNSEKFLLLKINRGGNEFILLLRLRGKYGLKWLNGLSVLEANWLAQSNIRSQVSNQISLTQVTLYLGKNLELNQWKQAHQLIDATSFICRKFYCISIHVSQNPLSKTSSSGWYVMFSKGFVCFLDEYFTNIKQLRVLVSQHSQFSLHLFICTWERGIYVPWYGAQGTVCGSEFCPSTVWNVRMKLRAPGLVEAPLPAEPSHQLSMLNLILMNFSLY